MKPTPAQERLARKAIRGQVRRGGRDRRQPVTDAFMRDLRDDMADRRVAEHEVVEADTPVSRARARKRAVAAAERVEAKIWSTTSAELREYRKALEAARAATHAAFADATKEWRVNDRRAVMASLDKALLELDHLATTGLTRAQKSAWDAGYRLVDSVTQAAVGEGGGLDLNVSLGPHVDPTLFLTAMQTTPELITNVTGKVRQDIANLLRLAALGQMTPAEVMKRSGSIAGKGPWASAALRGEAIYRTETGRMLQTANAHRMSQLGEGWQKEWVARIDQRTRPSHREANGQRRGLNENFIVGGFPMKYPHDPAAPARETVFCRCMAMPLRPEWDELGEPRELTPGERADAQFRDMLDEFESRRQAIQSKWDKTWQDARAEARKQLGDDAAAWRIDSRAVDLSQVARLARDYDLRLLTLWLQDQLKLLDLTGLSPEDIRRLIARAKAGLAALRAGRAYIGMDILDDLVIQWTAKLPLRERLADAPTYTGTGSRWLNKAWPMMRDIAFALDDMGWPVTWTGGLGSQAGRFAGTHYKGFINLSSSVAKYERVQDQMKVMLHELGHSVSSAAGKMQESYAAMKGWEEGVVEGWTQVTLPKVQAALGVDVVGAYSTYGQYVGPLRLAARHAGKSDEEWFEALIKVPLGLRPDWVASQVPEKVFDGLMDALQ